MLCRYKRYFTTKVSDLQILSDGSHKSSLVMFLFTFDYISFDIVFIRLPTLSMNFFGVIQKLNEA